MYNDNNGLETEDVTPAPPAEENSDLGVYRAMLRDEGVSEEIATRMIEPLFHIMRMCVEMGFTTDLCGQLLDGFNELAAPDSGKLDSSLSTSAETHENQKGEDHEQ